MKLFILSPGFDLEILTKIKIHVNFHRQDARAQGRPRFHKLMWGQFAKKGQNKNEDFKTFFLIFGLSLFLASLAFCPNIDCPVTGPPLGVCGEKVFVKGS
jgi:hypothetical protein